MPRWESMGGCLARMEEAEALARALDDQTRLGRVLAQMAPTLRMRRDLNRGMAVCQQALAIATALGAIALTGGSIL